MPITKLVTLEEAADQLRVSPQTVRAYAREHKWTKVRLTGRTVRLKQEEIEAFIATRSF